MTWQTQPDRRCQRLYTAGATAQLGCYLAGTGTTGLAVNCDAYLGTGATCCPAQMDIRRQSSLGHDFAKHPHRKFVTARIVIRSPGLRGIPGQNRLNAGGNTGPGWIPYRGATPAAWQYTDRADIAGLTEDCNAYPGTDLAVLFGFTPAIPPEHLATSPQ